jgi:hypothetical protein
MFLFILHCKSLYIQTQSFDIPVWFVLLVVYGASAIGSLKCVYRVETTGKVDRFC